jgi:hypothetical protein
MKVTNAYKLRYRRNHADPTSIEQRRKSRRRKNARATAELARFRFGRPPRPRPAARPALSSRRMGSVPRTRARTTSVVSSTVVQPVTPMRSNVVCSATVGPPLVSSLRPSASRPLPSVSRSMVSKDSARLLDSLLSFRSIHSSQLPINAQRSRTKFGFGRPLRSTLRSRIGQARLGPDWGQIGASQIRLREAATSTSLGRSAVTVDNSHEDAHRQFWPRPRSHAALSRNESG